MKLKTLIHSHASNSNAPENEPIRSHVASSCIRADVTARVVQQFFTSEELSRVTKTSQLQHSESQVNYHFIIR